jgi:hypothetical protein
LTESVYEFGDGSWWTLPPPNPKNLELKTDVMRSTLSLIVDLMDIHDKAHERIAFLAIGFAWTLSRRDLGALMYFVKIGIAPALVKVAKNPELSDDVRVQAGSCLQLFSDREGGDLIGGMGVMEDVALCFLNSESYHLQHYGCRWITRCAYDPSRKRNILKIGTVDAAIKIIISHSSAGTPEVDKKGSNDFNS